MILNNLDNINLDNYPVVIFGSGPVGITTALELEKKNINCLLIEAGGEDYSEASQEFYKGKVIGDPILGLSKSRLRQLGGSSGHWGMLSARSATVTFSRAKCAVAAGIHPYLRIFQISKKRFSNNCIFIFYIHLLYKLFEIYRSY